MSFSSFTLPIKLANCNSFVFAILFTKLGAYIAPRSALITYKIRQRKRKTHLHFVSKKSLNFLDFGKIAGLGNKGCERPTPVLYANATLYTLKNRREKNSTYNE